MFIITYMNLTSQPVELFLQQLSYLPFRDVISMCQTNTRTRNYCTNVRYSSLCKKLIDDTFGDTFNYNEKLEKIWQNLNVPQGTYNYLVYTRLVELLPPITQLRIYHRQGDMESFKSDKFTNTQRFLASFLLGDKEAANKFLPSDAYQEFIDLLNGLEPSKGRLDAMMIEMAVNGSPLGTAMFLVKGADIHARNESALYYACGEGHLDIVKYLVGQGSDIHGRNGDALIKAINHLQLDVMKYLVSEGASINFLRDYSLTWAREKGRSDVVEYIEGLHN